MIARRLGNKLESADPNTLLLLHGEDFTDSSMYQRAVTNNGATIDNAGKFSKCIKTGGTKYSRVQCPPFQPGSADFTIDFWIKATYTTSWDAIIGQRGTNISDIGWLWYSDTSKKMFFTWSTDGTTTPSEIISSTVPTNGVWEHWAVVRKGSTITMYLNGTNVASNSISGTIYATTQSLSIGYINYDATYGNGISAYIDELRISNIARWTGNFTPPTAPYDR